MNGILCGKCGSDNNRVVDSRPVPGGIRRRRECNQCGAKFTTYEYTEKQIARARRALANGGGPDGV